jgi:hypothetical protein
VGIVNPTEVHPGIMRALYRLCVRMPTGFGATTDGFVNLLAPKTAIDRGTTPRLSAERTVKEAVSIGVLEPVDEGRYGLALPKPPKRASYEAADAFFVRELRRLVLVERNNDPLFQPGSPDDDGDDDDQNGESDGQPLSANHSREFTRILCWLLLQDPARPPLEWTGPEDRNVQQMQGQYDGRDLVSNNNRWVNFRRWSQFLGFSRDNGKNGLIPDPTTAVQDAVAELDAGASELPVVELLGRLAEALPVIDGGAYRREVLTHVGLEETPDVASASLSLALLRLQDAGVIGFERRADYRGGSLVVGTQPYTHAVMRPSK